MARTHDYVGFFQAWISGVTKVSLKKTRVLGYRLWKLYDPMIVCFDSVPVCDRQTDCLPLLKTLESPWKLTWCLKVLKLSLKPGTHWRPSWIQHGRLCGKSTKSTVSLWPRTHWRPSRKDVRRSGDKNHPLLMKSTESNMCHFGDNVDRDIVDKSNEPAAVDF